MDFDEEAFDKYVEWWFDVRDKLFTNRKEGDQRIAAAYIGFVAGYIAARDGVGDAMPY